MRTPRIDSTSERDEPLCATGIRRHIHDQHGLAEHESRQEYRSGSRQRYTRAFDHQHTNECHDLQNDKKEKRRSKRLQAFVLDLLQQRRVAQEVLACYLCKD